MSRVTVEVIAGEGVLPIVLGYGVYDGTVDAFCTFVEATNAAAWRRWGRWRSKGLVARLLALDLIRPECPCGRSPTRVRPGTRLRQRFVVARHCLPGLWGHCRRGRPCRAP